MILYGFVGLTIIIVLGYFMRHMLGGMFGLYRIVPVNESHIRVMGNKKEIFSSELKKSSYWIVPFVTKLQKLPLMNLSIPVDNIKLNDIDMAKFTCEITCFVRISNVELAAERLVLTNIATKLGFDDERLSADLRTIIESIGRTVAAKQTILDIYKNREALSSAVTTEVQKVFPAWGIELVNLELKHIKDVEGSTIIADIEKLRAAEITRDAAIRVATTTRESKIAEAESLEAYRKREIQKDQAVEIARQDALMLTNAKTAEANMQRIEADRKIQVGNAEIAKQVVEQTAMGQRIKIEQDAEAQKMQILAIGQAQADMVKAKLVAEAEGQLKLAEAMKAVSESALPVKRLDVQKEVMIAKFQSLGAALQKAEIKLIMSGEKSGNLFGLDFNAETGANLGQFLETSDITPEKIQQVVTALKTK